LAIKLEYGELAYQVKGVKAAASSPAIETFERLSNLSDDILCVLEVSEGRFQVINNAFQEMFGYTKDELLEHPFLNFVHSEDQAATTDAVKQIADEKPVIYLENRYRHKDGSYKWLSWTFMPVPGEGLAYAAARDITRHKRAEDVLRLAESKYRTLVESIPAVIYTAVINETNTTQYISPQIKSLLGFTPDDYKATPDTWRWQLHPEDSKRVLHEVAQSHHSNEPLNSEYRMLTRHKNVIWVHDMAEVLRDEAGNPLLLRGVMVDITEQKRMELELVRANRTLIALCKVNEMLIHAENEEQLLDEACQNIVESGGYSLAWVGYAEQDTIKSVKPVALVGVDAGYINALNITWEDTEWNSEPTGTAIRTGQASIARGIQPDRSTLWQIKALEHGFHASIALPIIVESKTIGALNIYASEPDAFGEQEAGLLNELVGDVAYAITTLRTGTSRNRAEEDIRMALEEKEVLLKEVHHQVKNNLQMISNLLSLQVKAAKGEKFKASLQDSRQRIKIMTMVHETLYQSGNHACLNAPPFFMNIIREVTGVFAPDKKHISLRTYVEDVALSLAQAIPVGLVLYELLTNALKYAFPSEQSGTIIVSLRQRQENKVEMCIADDGVGLPKNLNWKKSHTLGLMLVLALTKKLHGELAAGQNHGTCFTITFDRVMP